MAKRILSTVLLLSYILSFSIVPVRATEADYQTAEIVVDSFGNQHIEKVLINEGHTLFAPISWFTKYGLMAHMEESNRYVFYYAGEEAVKPFTKRIYIDVNGREVSCGCYVTETKFQTYMTHKFSQSIISENTLYLPVAEMLPLFNAKIEITDDGILHINANAVSVFSALYGLNLQDLAFDADRDVVGHEFMTASGMLIDTILGLRIDRLDGLFNTGEYNDYRELFKAYLVDDAVFLSAYDEDQTPTEQFMETKRNNLKGIDGLLSDAKIGPDFLGYILDSELYPGFHDFKEFYSGMSDTAEGIYKIADYSNTYMNQVDDHLNMLEAVYSTEFFGEANPAYKAAVQIADTYGSGSAKQRKEIVHSALYDFIVSEFGGTAVKEFSLTPYKIAFKAVKLALPEAVEEVGKAAQLGYMDDVVNHACRVFDKRTQDMQFDTESLNELRLTVMLALVASRHAYNTFWEDHEKIEKISDVLMGLYLAAESVECESADHYNASTNEIVVDYPYWYSFMIRPQKRDVYSDAEYISKFLFADFIELEGLSEEDYKSLINDYVSAMSKGKSNQQNQGCYSLSSEQISEIIDFSRRSSNALLHSRPLYIMLATDAIINGRDISHWDTTQMMQYIYDRDLKQWQDNIQDDLILGALENTLTYSTIFGEWSIEHSFRIGDRCVNEDIEKGLKMPDKRGPVKDWLAQMCEFQDCNIWSLKMRAYEPDIVGEFYVLKQLENCIASKDDWYELIFANLSKSKFFLERACQDYANTNLAKILVGILKALTSKVSVEHVAEAECVIRIWELFYTEVEDKTLKGVALTGIQTICNKLLYQSRLIDETNIRFFYANPVEHTNSWREHRFTDYKQFYKKWPDSPEIVTVFIEVLGEMASWYYRNGNVPKGNAYSKTLNSVISRCSIHEGGVLVSYIDALGSIISGHYYMNDDADVEAEIDDEFKLETLVAELKTEAHAIAYIDAIKKTIVQQSKYTEDHKIVKSIEQFCKHINEWMEHEDWYVFRWNIGSVIPFAVDLLFTHKKRKSGENLFDNYLELIEKYIKVQYKVPNLMISHFSTGLDKLIKSPMIPEEVKAKICKFECI